MWWKDEIKRSVERALAEDAVNFDETSQLVVPETLAAEGCIRARETGVFSGVAVCEAISSAFGSDLNVKSQKVEGAAIEEGEAVVGLSGNARACLAAERTLLNYLSLTCGVASLTRKYVEAVRSFSTKILATRKTIPGLRALQLIAVESGGGHIHRRSLSDGVLIKDNHLTLTSIGEAIEKAKQECSPLHRVEIEVDTLEQLKEALSAKPDVVLLDNFELDEMRKAVELVNGCCLLEVSGGVDLQSVRSIAETGVNMISVGRLTHSVPAFDFSLEM